MTENPPDPSIAELLEAIEDVYARVGRDKDILPGELRYTSNWRGSPLQMLPLAARGLYSEMLTQAWSNRARLAQTDEEEIMRLVRATPAEWESAWPRIRHYWAKATDPATGAEILVNRKQLEVYVGALRSREVTLARNRKANLASVESRKRAKEATAPSAAPQAPTVQKPKPGPREVPPCPECSGELKRKQGSASPGGQRYPPAWYCASHGSSLSLNDPRVYGNLSHAAQKSIDHDLKEYERAIAATTGPDPASARRPARPATTTPPPGPSALERSRPL